MCRALMVPRKVCAQKTSINIITTAATPTFPALINRTSEGKDIPADCLHRGVAIDDPRNEGPIAFFRPKKVTRESLRQSLTQVSRGKTPDEIEAKVQEVMDKIARGPIRPDPPMSESLDEVADPRYGLGSHPDIIDALPQRCRWVFWGGPALVHPATGVVFARGFGTIGYVMRLLPHVLESAQLPDAKVIVTGNPWTELRHRTGGARMALRALGRTGSGMVPRGL